MTVLVTGAAGFIGFHTARVLLARGENVVGIDNVNDYYDPTLKEARLAILQENDGFDFERADIADKDAVAALLSRRSDIDRVVHLAAQAGVRYSLINPYAYMRSNLDGHVVLMEAVRKLPNLRHFVYASSSSVYGANTKLPFSVDDPVDHPVSLYAATKRSQELLSESYARMFGLPLTGLRFFTVYGPWGRPDMAAFIFTKNILAGKPIPVFNNGDMRRDFTFVEDIVQGVIGCLDGPAEPVDGKPPHRVYNIGNNASEKLMDFIAILEQ
ncbi:MAG: SDR family NAD(P)-dependent oxidoreductase, partial [Rhodospirillales bacterium]|nr:SDR family NAD(P)-dependent oxidoreductase [Rhodospirillales bacterium]